jgi:hypothetical protein
MSYMRSMGDEIWDPKTGRVEWILDTPENAHALQMYKDLLKYQPPGAVNFGISELIDAFTQGKCFSAWHWRAIGPAMIAPKLKGKVEVMPLPTFKDKSGKRNRNYIVGTQPWVQSACRVRQPTTNIDALAKQQLIRALKEFRRQMPQTAIYVTHDQTEAMTLADQVALIQAGSITQCAAPSFSTTPPKASSAAGSSECRV